MHAYSAKVLDEIVYTPGAWHGLKVGVFRVENEREEQVGQYERNYPTLFRTFCHFRKDDQDFALYSPDYTVTRVMELPTCRDIGGEEPNSYGFCPVDFYVPSYIDREFVGHSDEVHQHRVNNPSPENLVARINKYTLPDEKTGERVVVEKPSYPVSPLLYYPFGFVAGCIWGDDSSWKIQHLDLSEAQRGVIKREEKFGYIAMPDEMTLRQAVNMVDYMYDPAEEYAHHITIAVQRRFDLRTGKPVEINPFL